MSVKTSTLAVFCFVVGFAAIQSGWAQTYPPKAALLYTFCVASDCKDGATPRAGLIRDAAGNLYGTTVNGGATLSGTVFKLDATGHETVLYSFCSLPNCADGEQPYGGVIEDSDGNLYGTTMAGGNPNCAGSTYLGCGTVFKVDQTGNETVLYSFCPLANCADGALPLAGVIRDTAGNLYGTTNRGGQTVAGAATAGTVFKVDTTGHERVLYSFCALGFPCPDGAYPSAGLVEDANGNLYGTTSNGGGPSYSGTVFKVDSTGQETVLHNFCSSPQCTDGLIPYANLILDDAGNLYGTTAGGGTNQYGQEGGLSDFGNGIVFKVDSAGNQTVLYTFCSFPRCVDGGVPEAGLFRDAAGNLYGTTTYGGAHHKGTVFKVDVNGQETLLHAFCYAKHCADGELPYGAVIEDAAGNLYGTTSNGAIGYGTVFKLVADFSITLTSNPNPSNLNQSVTFSAVVSGGGVTPTGSITFEEGKIVLGSATLENGIASFTTTFSKHGGFSVVASYSGDNNYKAANSRPLKQVVRK